jgi:hypothetical protein
MSMSCLPSSTPAHACPSPPPSPGPRRNATDRQKVQNDTKEAKERERLAPEVEQLKSQLEKEKKRRLSQSVAEPTAKNLARSLNLPPLLLGKNW